MSVVNLGANPNTPVAAVRAAEVAAYLDHLEGEDLRAAFMRLQSRIPAPRLSLALAREL